LNGLKSIAIDFLQLFGFDQNELINGCGSTKFIYIFFILLSKTCYKTAGTQKGGTAQKSREKNNTFAGTDPLIPKDISICICQIGGAILFRPES